VVVVAEARDGAAGTTHAGMGVARVDVDHARREAVLGLCTGAGAVAKPRLAGRIRERAEPVGLAEPAGAVANALTVVAAVKVAGVDAAGCAHDRWDPPPKRREGCSTAEAPGHTGDVIDRHDIRA